MAEKSDAFGKSLILICVIMAIIILGAASYFYSASSQNAALSSISTSATPGGVATANTTMPGASNMSSVSIQQNATTQHYKLSLLIGLPAQMLSMNQTGNATSGEVMVRGEMAIMVGMNVTGMYHLEIHVYNLTTGVVLSNMNVTIHIVNDNTNQTENVPVAVMYDVTIGPSDTHFGNNVSLSPGNYTVIVNVSADTATFHITIPTQ